MTRMHYILHAHEICRSTGNVSAIFDVYSGALRIARGIERLVGAYGSVLGKYQRARRVRAIERSPFGPPGVQLLPAGVPSPRFYLSRVYTRVIKGRARKFKSTWRRWKGLNERSGLFMIGVRIRVPLMWSPIDAFSLNGISSNSSTTIASRAKLHAPDERLFCLSRSKILGSSSSTFPWRNSLAGCLFSLTGACNSVEVESGRVATRFERWNRSAVRNAFARRIPSVANSFASAFPEIATRETRPLVFEDVCSRDQRFRDFACA